MKKISITFLIIFCLINKIYAQCNPATSIGIPTVIHASCPGNGQITVGAVGPAVTAPDFYQYALYDTSGNNIIAPYQTSNVFTSINAGIYDIYVRRVCAPAGGFSQPLKRRVTVNNTEVPPAFATTAVTLLRADVGCGTGRFQVNALGSGPKQYALVASLGEPNPANSYIRPPQSSAIFDSLPAGTYYARIINTCGNAVTTSITIPVQQNANLGKLKVLQLHPLGCDSVIVSVAGITNFIMISGTRDTGLVKVFVNWPGGGSDTTRPVHTTQALGYGTPQGAASTSLATFRVHISKLDPNYSSNTGFWDNVTNWPLNIHAGFKDICGNIYDTTFIKNKPLPKVISINSNEQDPASTCDSVAMRFQISYRQANNSAIDGYHLFNTTYGDFKYSLDSGATWNPAWTGNIPGDLVLNVMASDKFVVPRGKQLLFKLAMCGDTINQVLNTPPLPVYAPTVSGRYQFSCPGLGGIAINPRKSPIGVEMVSAPAGQAIVPYFVLTGAPAAEAYPPQLANLLPGTYQIRLWDTIGVDCPQNALRTVTISQTAPVLNFDLGQDCDLNFINVYTDYNLSSPTNTYNQVFRAEIFNSAGVAVTSAVTGVTGIMPGYTVARINVSALNEGETYTIRAYRAGGPTDITSCTRVEKTWVKGSNKLNLTSSRFVPGCAGGTGTIVAAAAGGTAPYTYILKDPSNNTISASAGNNIYNNLNPNTVYTLQVIDNCGSIVNRSMEIGGDLPVFISGFTTMPCLGDDFTLSVLSLPGVSYQWLKNDISITSATTNELPFSDINIADAGDYKSRVNMGNCVVLTKIFTVDPARCGQTLPVRLNSFIAYEKEKTVILKWNTGNEINNKGFEIEHSADGIIWTSIGFVKSLTSSGNSSISLDYSFVDKRPLPGRNFYRLKQIDIDGNSEYSNIEIVTIQESKKIIIYPNPAKEFVKIDGLREGETVRLFDVSGKMLVQEKNSLNHLRISLAHLNDGAYFIQVLSKNNTVIHSEKLFKIK